MPSRHLFLALALLLSAGVGQGALQSVEEAVELRPGDLTLPVSGSGRLLLRACAQCRLQGLQLDADTRYIVQPGTVAVPFPEFSKTLASAAGRPGTAVFVYYDPQRSNVHRIVLNPGRAARGAAP